MNEDPAFARPPGPNWRPDRHVGLHLPGPCRGTGRAIAESFVSGHLWSLLVTAKIFKSLDFGTWNYQAAVLLSYEYGTAMMCQSCVAPSSTLNPAVAVLAQLPGYKYRAEETIDDDGHWCHVATVALFDAFLTGHGIEPTDLPVRL
jgi:hypothetical protein